MTLAIRIESASPSARLCLAGSLDYQTTADFVGAVAEVLHRHPAPARLHLDLSGLTFCDSAGLAGLLLVHRRTSQAGVSLHLDHRPQFLDRILDITGTFEHLVTSAPAGEDSPGETGVR